MKSLKLSNEQMLIMRKLSANLMIIAFLGVLLGSCTKEKQRTNILFIAVDDLRPELGCYGNSVVKSPNIDKLASKGLVFTNHFVQAPTCGASRHCLLTGNKPSKPSHLSNNAIEAELSDKPVIELYDYHVDPHETKNWASLKPKIVEKLMPVLEKGNTGIYEIEIRK